MIGSARMAGADIFAPTRLAELVDDARERSLALLADLSDEQLAGPVLEIVNPLLWEIGHVAWFQEKWVLREALGHPPLRADADALWDSIAIAHDHRWELPLPGRDETLAYADDVRRRVKRRLLQGRAGDAERYFVLYTLQHEDMHGEAFTYTRQTLGYPRPALGESTPAPAQGTLEGDVELPATTFLLGARREAPFVFDNEKWAHPVEVARFSIARAPVTQAEFMAFVEDDGYDRRELWSEAGWQDRRHAEAGHPVYWRRAEGGGFERRDFDRWVSLEPDLPVIHVNWFEAQAFCRWAGRRLPTEAEWERAAATSEKHSYPWGEESPTPEHARLDGRGLGCAAVAAHAKGDSACGCRQMLGNVWEWTATRFGPYPGFAADAYAEYSEPWFGTRRVLRGGCWTTRSRLVRNTLRNFYEPHRRDVFAGFRTCAP